MGYRYEVSAWLDKNGFRYVQLYAGKSLIKSIITMLIIKRSGCGCVKLEWR